ncbi:MAG TPA: peptidyl-prolyl cis-trans isomerase [Rhizomicrobium sp.]|jgi:peptidyl-prolyl cis-trans isomerase D
MLQAMRKYSRGVIATVFMGALALSFGVWGIADIFRGNTDTSIATVGGEKVPQELFERDYRAITRQASRVAPLKPAQEKAYGKQALDQLIDQVATDSYLKRYGLVVSDQEVTARIRAIPAFAGPLGTFDHEQFLRAIQNAGFDSEQQFVDLVRGELMRSQFLTAVGDGLELPSGYARMLFNYLNEVRAADYITLPANAAGTVPTPTDAQLQSFVAAHAAKFSTPEYRSVTVAWLSPQDIVGQMKATDAQLKQQYEAEKSQYQTPEKRTVEQLVLPTEAAAKAARAKLDSGTTFADLAKQQGKSEQDISLGSVSEDDLAERGKAVFALPQGGVSQPLKAPVGYSLIHVVSITPGTTKSFDDVKEDLRKELSMQLATAKLADLNNQYIDESSRGEPLAVAARKVGMKVTRVAAMDAAGNTPDGKKADLPADPELLQQIFKADVGEEGDPFVTKSGATYVLKVEGVQPPKLKPLDSVRAQATAEWQKQEIAKRLEAKAKELAARASSTGSLEAIAASVGAKVEQSPPLRRPLANQQNTSPLPTRLLAKVFTMPMGQAVYGPTADGSSYIIARVTGVQHPPAAVASDLRLRGFARQLGQQAGSDLGENVAAAARAEEGVTINQQNVNRVVGGDTEGG